MVVSPHMNTFIDFIKAMNDEELNLFIKHPKTYILHYSKWKQKLKIVGLKHEWVDDNAWKLFFNRQAQEHLFGLICCLGVKELKELIKNIETEKWE